MIKGASENIVCDSCGKIIITLTMVLAGDTTDYVTVKSKKRILNYHNTKKCLPKSK
jgi:hypothetical protein